VAEGAGEGNVFDVMPHFQTHKVSLGTSVAMCPGCVSGECPVWCLLGEYTQGIYMMKHPRANGTLLSEFKIM